MGDSMCSHIVSLFEKACHMPVLTNATDVGWETRFLRHTLKLNQVSRLTQLSAHHVQTMCTTRI